MFLINRVKLEGTRDYYLLEKLNNGSILYQTNLTQIQTLLEPYTKRLNNLDIEKINCFDPDFNFYQNPVQVSARHHHSTDTIM